MEKTLKRVDSISYNSHNCTLRLFNISQWDVESVTHTKVTPSALSCSTSLPPPPPSHTHTKYHSGPEQCSYFGGIYSKLGLQDDERSLHRFKAKEWLEKQERLKQEGGSTSQTSSEDTSDQQGDDSGGDSGASRTKSEGKGDDDHSQQGDDSSGDTGDSQGDSGGRGNEDEGQDASRGGNDEGRDNSRGDGSGGGQQNDEGHDQEGSREGGGGGKGSEGGVEKKSSRKLSRVRRFDRFRKATGKGVSA